MSYEQYKHANENAVRDAMTSDNPMVAELVAVLAPHPGGLRRWSVMRAIRKNREAASRDIPLKLEADIERAFRQFCSDSADSEMRKGGQAIFYRPAEKAGEVWALHRAHVTATAK